jgi:hypothetical protein
MTDAPVSALERLDAILTNPATFVLSAQLPDADRSRGGRPRHYPSYMLIVFEALISVYGSARQVEAELAHPLVWTHLRNLARKHARSGRARDLPSTPMRRHHYLYARKRCLATPGLLDALMHRHRELAAEQAVALGLCDPDGSGSWTHPHLDRMLHADGKVIAPLYRAKPVDARVDPTTGEIRPRRAEGDAGLHFEGTGEATWGTKFVLVAARTNDVHGRVILDVQWVPRPGGEAAAALESFGRLAPLLPGAHGVIYDTALRGVHHQRMLRELGWLTINRVTAAKSGPTNVQRRRLPKSAHVETKTITLADGTPQTLALYARDGAIGLGELDDRGNLRFVPLRRVRTHRTRDKIGRYRWYNDYELPDHFGARTVTVRLHATDVDARRRFNRTENVRPIPADDPDFQRLYRRRNDAESINRHLDDTLWLGRAHSLGHQRQTLNLLGYALMTNSLARARRRPVLDQAA